MNHSTITGNTSGWGGGAYQSTLNNCIIYGNSSYDHAGCTINYSCTTADPFAPSGTGNITNDPQFVDAAAGDYRLKMNSPCLDAGNNAYVVGTTDLDGNPRIVNGIVDMGAYEGPHALPELAIIPANTNLSYKAANGVTLAVTANVLWTAATNVPWLVISSGASSKTNGTVLFRAEGNAMAVSRTGAVVVAGGGLSRTCTVVQAGNTGWDVGYQNLGNGWQRLTWFGDYIPAGEDGWIWHNKHGSLFVSSTSTPENIWFYSLDMGWLWTSSTTYPYLFRASDGATLWYNGNSNPRWFMNFTTGQWESWPGASASEWYVTTHGNDAAAGTSWGTAKRTIQAAVDAAKIGSRVWVSNGIYAGGGATNYPAGSTLTNRVAIHKAITVQSVNGPEVTIIQGARDPSGHNGIGDAAVRCVYVGSNAVLTGFTVTNGATQGERSFDNKGGGVFCEESGVLNHCTLIGNSACYDGGGVLGGTLNFCTLSDNRVEETGYLASGGGGAYQATLNSCILSNNYAPESGSGAFQSTLNDCLIINNGRSNYGGGNGRSNYGGGANNCTLSRCRLSQNSATQGGGAYNCTLNNCLVDNNLPGMNGGGAFESTLYNCTAVSNNVEVCDIYNSILFNVGLWWGGDCISTYTGDPQFVDEAAGDYRLSNRSPCIDAGNNAYVHGETDLDGNPRVVAGSVDQGAFEFQGFPTYRGWAAGITNGQTNDTDCAAGDGVPNVLKYAAGSTNPMVPDDLATLGLNLGPVPTLVFHRNPNAVDLQWLIEGADVLSNGVVWRGLATNLNGSWGGATNVHESGTGTPVVCTVDDPLPLLTNRFLRLKVTRP